MNNNHKLFEFTVILFCALSVSISSHIFAQTPSLTNTPPQIIAKTTPLLEVDNLKFKDLNKNGILNPYEDWRLPVEERIEDLLNQMTLAEKVGQMFHPRLYVPKSGNLTESFVKYEEVYSPAMAERMILRFHFTHFLNNGRTSPSKMATWANHIQQIAEGGRLGIPVIFFSDPRWSPVFPLGLAAARDVDLVERFGKATAQRYRAVGLHEGHKLYLDVATEPRWGRVGSTLGEDAELNAQLINAYIKGCQGKELGKDSMIFFAVIFPGSGPQKDGIDSHSQQGQDLVYPGDNLDYHLIPWKSAIKTGLWKVMPYYAIPRAIDDVGANYSHATITGLLRNKLGYDGLVCTDWGVLGRPWGLKKKLGHSPSMEEKVTLLFNAGIDQIGVWYYRNVGQTKTIMKLVREGKITEQRIDQSIRRIMVNKFKLGLFENPYVDPENADKILNSKEHKQLERELRFKSNVLLTNDDILPLAKDTKIFATGIDKKEISKYGRLVNNPKEADVAIVKIKYNLSWGVQNLNLPATLRNKVKKMVEMKIPTILVINMDRPLVMPWVVENTAAILATYGATDDVIVETLFGDYTPSGKLAIEIPRSMKAVKKQFEDLPWDSEDPIFPFGYGMTYRTVKVPKKYKLKNFQVSPTEIRSGEDITIHALVTNVERDQCVVFRALVDGQVVTAKPYGLKAKTERKISFTLSLYEEGSHNIAIEDVSPLTVNVGPSPDTLENFEIMGNKPTTD